MRDIPGLRPLLDRAAAQAQQPPKYRFHGNRNPANRERTPILAQEPSASVKDGVAKMRLYDVIDSWGGSWGISALEFLSALDEIGEDVEEIRLHINSPGGEVWEALAILNSLRAHPARLVAIVDGIAASAASFIAAAADETIMSPNTQLMIHDAWGLCIGNAADMRNTGGILDQISDNIASIYADKSGGTTAEWRAIMLDEGWYSAQEAVDAGLADKIAGEEPAEDPEDAFDLKGIGLKYNGRADAPPPRVPVETQPNAADMAAFEERRLRMQRRQHAENERKLTPA
jgi:ATP-dependent protease ClpP protease subunit